MKSTILSFVIFTLLVTSIIPITAATGDVFDDGGLDTKSASRGLSLVFSSYIGGSEDDWIMGNSFDNEGNQFIVGQTFSDDIVVLNGFQETFGGNSDGYLAKFDTDNELVFATYIGGNGTDDARSVIVDEQGNVIIAGYTESQNFQVLNALQDELLGDRDGYLAKFSPEGELLFSTYIGGSGDLDIVERLAFDPYGNYLLVGETDSVDLQTTPGVFQENYGGGISDSFILAISEDGQSVEYCSYLGEESQQTLFDIAFSSEENLGVVGITYSGWNATDQALQQDYGGGQTDSFVAMIGPNCSSLEWSTLLGGDGWEFGDNLEFDSNNDVIVAGYSGSNDYPLVNPIFTNNGSYDAFLSKISSDGTTLLSSTHIGGNREDRSYGMCLLSDDTVVMTSPAGSSDLPTPNGLQTERDGGTDAYVAILDSEDWSIDCASYLGGDRGDYCMGLSVFNDSRVLITGYSNSLDFPLLNPIQENNTGNADGFVVLISIIDQIEEGDSILPVLPIGIGAAVIVIMLAVIIYRKRTIP